MDYRRVVFLLPRVNDTLIDIEDSDHDVDANLEFTFKEGEDSSVVVKSKIKELEDKKVSYICYGCNEDEVVLISSNLPIQIPDNN